MHQANGTHRAPALARAVPLRHRQGDVGDLCARQAPRIGQERPPHFVIVLLSLKTILRAFCDVPLTVTLTPYRHAAGIQGEDIGMVVDL